MAINLNNGGLTGMHRITADKDTTKFIKEDDQLAVNTCFYTILSR
jgi:hypothetical protein